MTPPPLVCPQAGPRDPGPDCPLYNQRLERRDEGERLRRAILAELGQSGPSLRDLIRSDALAADAPEQSRPRPLLLPPSSAPLPPLFIHHRTKGRTP